MTAPDCDLCRGEGGIVLFRTAVLRIVRVENPDYPGFCRVIANRHAKEMTDLSAEERAEIFDAVVALESAIRRLLFPDKINLASLGNLTPHVHWHVIPRWKTDVRFPDPIWGPTSRTGVVPAPVGNLDDRIATELRGALHRP